jgi:hypothetical protein
MIELNLKIVFHIDRVPDTRAIYNPFCVCLTGYNYAILIRIKIINVYYDLYIGQL